MRICAMLGAFYKLYYSAPTVLRRACKAACCTHRSDAVVISTKQWNKLCMRVVKDNHAYIFKFYAIRRRNCIKINIPLGLISSRVMPEPVPAGINQTRVVVFYTDSLSFVPGRKRVRLFLTGMRVHAVMHIDRGWDSELLLLEILTQICSN